MFRNLRIHIFIYYLLTVSAFLMTLHYLLAVARVENMFLLSLVMVCLVTLGGVMISKLSIDPLEEHVSNLQNLSKETLHELNLPTSTIITNVQMLQKNSTDEKERKRAVEALARRGFAWSDVKRALTGYSEDHFND